MSKASVTDAFCKQLKSLRLNEYPIVGGVAKKDRRKPNVFDDNEKEKSDEVVEMIDLIKDKKSPWYETYDWSKDCESIRERYIKDQSSINFNKIEQYFTNLRLNSQNIASVDDNIKNFVNLEELVLTCNSISECNLSNLPNSLRIFDLSANLIRNIHNLTLKTKTSIQHFGLAYNSIEHIEQFFNIKQWSSLVSLDLSSNNLQDLNAIINEFENLKSLKVLILSRNPLVILPGYRGLIVDSLPNLFSLDDVPITKEERINFQDFKLYSAQLTDHAEIKFKFLEIRNLIFSEIPDFEDEPEIFTYKYFIRFESIEDFDIDNNKKIESTEEFEPMSDIILNDKGLVQLKFKSIKKLRDFLIDGTRIELVEKKINYRLKNYEPPSEEELKKKKKAEKKDEKKEEKKDTKKKKKTMASILENYNQISTMEKVVIDFKMDLESVLEGTLKEIEKSYVTKQKVDSNISGSQTPASRKIESRKGKKDEKASKSVNKKKTEADITEPVEQPPLEFYLKFQILDFDNFKEVKEFYDANNVR